MNALGWLILGSIVHATGYAVIASIAYVALRRWSPAAGSLAAASSLVIMALVSLIVLGPWPRWWSFSGEQARQSSIAASRQTPRSREAPQPGDRDGMAPADEDDGRGSAISPGPPGGTGAVSTWMSRFLNELRRTKVVSEEPRWDWPEFLALAFFASLGLGLARLGLGIWSIQGLRARCQAVDEPELLDMVEILRAELSCLRNVQIRETDELATPATIGWRRPLLLLPAEWRDWNTAERRAVLAHELAHVCRGDFLMGLIAQASLTVHFHNPLAHWLARRLRLEQELAADAWGARLAGGTQSYLATLAQMALRRDSRAPTWPARAFLPSRGTFVRRIEMLRNASRIRHAPLPALVQLITVGVLSALGLLVAGVRGPLGLSTTQAQPQEPVAVGGQNTATESYNLAFVPADAKMIVAVRPQAVLARREARALLESIKQSSAFKGALAVPPEEVEQVVVFWEGTPQSPSELRQTPLVPLPSGGVLRTSKPQEWKSVLSKLHLGSTKEVRHDGQTYQSIGGSDPTGWGAFAPDDRTLVFAREDLLRELIDDRKAPAPHFPWDEAWNKVVKGQIVVALETRWLRRRITQGVSGGPSAPGQALETISPLLDKARYYAIAIDSSRGLTLDLMAITGALDDAKLVADTLQALLTFGKNAVRGMRQDRRDGNAMNGEAVDWIVETADSLLNAARIDISGSQVHVQAKSNLDLAGGVKLLVPAVAAANTASRRVQSTNNLKQIALAFHNYNEVNKGLPTPVLYGGSNKTIPFSWRVAVLPYLDQNELYKRYNFDEPWDGPNNRKLLDLMPAIFSYPGLDGSPTSRTNTAYFVFTGDGAALVQPPKASANPTFADFTDGLSNTILAVESKRDVPWTKPEDIPFDVQGPLPELKGFVENGFNAAFTDGSVRFISKSIDPTVMKALITRDGGESISIPDGPDRVKPSTR